MEKSYYFKTKEDIARYGISPNLIYEDDPQCIPISEGEYNNAIAELEAKAEADNNIIEEANKLEEQVQAYKILLGEEE